MGLTDIKTLSLDLETYSEEDLLRCGVYRYSESPSFEILLFGYSANGGPAAVVDLSAGEEIPREILSALQDNAVLKWAFNASFERVCLSRWLCARGLLPPGQFLSPASWRCTMVWSAYLGLPQSLAGVGEALSLDKQKLSEGKELVRFFCKPCAPTRANGFSSRNLPAAWPEKWERFIAYNLRDVETEQGIQARLSHYPVPEDVWDEYAMDQAINDRGILADLSLARSAMAMDGRCREALSAELRRLTNLQNPNSVAQVRAWLSDHGEEMANLSKKEVALRLKSAPPEIRDVLLLRQQMAKTSVKKYQAMADAACADGRVRGMFQFYGAARSGRWAGRNVQLQNLPQNHLPSLGAFRSLVLSGRDDVVEMLAGSVPDVLSELIRTAFIPSPGKKFIVSDFSAIEARVIAWLGSEGWRMKVFADGGDIYCASASRMFHVPVEKHGVNGHLRQKGKIAELALGYGGSVGALKAMGALDYGVQEDELQPLVDAWRKANPQIVQLWWDVDTAVKKAIRERIAVSFGIGEKAPQRRFVFHELPGGLSFICRSGMLFIRLPSGRCLSYVKPRLGVNRFGGESVNYLGVGPARKWERIESYGPKFVENIVQGIARDLLCSAMRKLRDCAIVAHVHDELILEAPPEMTVEEVSARMAETPPWAEGLQLRADGYECLDFYRKD